MDALTLHRVAHWMYLHRIRLLPKIIQLVIFILFNSYIPYQLVIGKRIKIGHRGIGVVMKKEATIDEQVPIRAHITIGKKFSNGNAPRIGNNVELGDGSKILGDIKIGDGTIVGVNAAVVKDMPDKGVTVKIVDFILCL